VNAGTGFRAPYAAGDAAEWRLSVLDSSRRVMRAVSGDDGEAESALVSAYRQHYRRLLKLATLLARDEDSGRDLVQEAFIRSMDRLTTLPAGAVLPYLRRAVVNLSISRSRRHRVELRFLSSREPANATAVSFEDHEVIWAAVSRLPPRQRACVVLRYFEDLTQEETALVLNCAVGTVRSQTSKAISRLRKELGDGYRTETA
jgi:RNA polymerase sigma-70 factor (sigma-E family)